MQGAGKTPRWDQAFDIDVKYLGDDVNVKVFDEDVTSSDLVSIKHLTKYVLCRLVSALSSCRPCVSTLALMNGSRLRTRANRLVPSISSPFGGLPAQLLAQPELRV